jgi:hypothetical protein
MHEAPPPADIASPSAPASASPEDAISARVPTSGTHAHPPQRVHVPRMQHEPVSDRRAARPSRLAHVPHATAMRAAGNTSAALPARSTTRTDASFAQAWPGGSGYTSITISAAIPPRAATSPNRQANNNNTGWMNHMTQRRVTEIPEQFGQ